MFTGWVIIPIQYLTGEPFFNSEDSPDYFKILYMFGYDNTSPLFYCNMYLIITLIPLSEVTWINLPF